MKRGMKKVSNQDTQVYNDKIKIAVVQMNSLMGEKDKNIDKTINFINEAADKRVNLIVFPELCNTGYMFNSRSELFMLAEEIPAGITVQTWINIAKEKNIYIVGGIAEREENRIYNSAVIVGPEGYIGTYRKCHLWFKEKLIFDPGNLNFPVFELPFGRIGIQICYDFYFLEGTRILALQGADIIVVPTNWPAGVNTWDKQGYCMGNHRAIVYANANKVYIACANRVGTERGQMFSGSSIITGPNGSPITGPAGKDTEEIMIAKLDIMESRRSKYLDLDESLHDRRCDIYDKILGYPKESK